MSKYEFFTTKSDEKFTAATISDDNDERIRLLNISATFRDIALNLSVEEAGEEI